MVVLTKKSISVTLSGNPTVTTLDDGNFLVHVGTGNATITSYSPAETGSGSSLRNGSSYNIVGTVDYMPFDGRFNYNATYRMVLPKACVAGDSVCIALSAPLATHRPRPSYWSAWGRSHVDEMLNLQFVGYPQAADQMRPFGIGNSAGVRTLRGTQVLKSQVNVASLPTTIALAGLPNVPAWAYFEGLLSDFCGEVMDGWGTDWITPDLQHPSYGSYYAGLVSQICVMLCSDASTQLKTPLAIRVAQWGMDLWGAFLDGRQNYAEGGHSAGRKALIMLAGYLLNNSGMRDPDRSLGASRFMENDSFRKFNPAGQWWFDSPVWDRKYVFKYNAGTQGEHQKVFPTTPSTWDATDTLGFASYMPHVVGAQVGIVVSMRLLGLETQYGTDVCAFVDQWMAGMGDTTLQILNTSRPEFANITWGHDYSVGLGANMSETAYANHNP